MKWVKTKAQIVKYLRELPEGTTEEAKERMLLRFKPYENKEQIEKLLDEYATYRNRDRYHKWGYEAEIPLSYDPEQEALNDYELYAGGWIDFWDTEVRQDSTDHALYFTIRDCGDKKYMTAYILQLNPVEKIKFNVYVNIANPPTSTDPPPPPPGRW